MAGIDEGFSPHVAYATLRGGGGGGGGGGQKKLSLHRALLLLAQASPTLPQLLPLEAGVRFVLADLLRTAERKQGLG